eukprot:scaffold8464_cov57-Phaeocystis_antarctica.AAC.2
MTTSVGSTMERERARNESVSPHSNTARSRPRPRITSAFLLATSRGAPARGPNSGSTTIASSEPATEAATRDGPMPRFRT